MVLDKIKIFDNNGNLVNYRVDGNSMYVTVNFPKISTGLIENQRLYVLEEVWDSLNSKVAIGSPKLNSSATISLSDDEFSLFKVDEQQYEISTDVSTEDVFSDAISDTSNSFTPDGYRQVISVFKKPIVIDLLFKASCEGNFEAEMILEENGKKIIFTLYAEAEGTDERLVNLLNRFGENISQNEEIIFREADINDDFQSNIVLNEKRKALLNEIYELPYLSSIRGLEFILKYFCYDDITKIKEYYLDTTDNKIITFEHDDIASDRTRYQKLSQFGLCYALNKTTGEFDECGNPLTEDTFTMPIEEVIVKLFALKKYIERRNVGGISKIIDIVGERLSFRRYKMNFWQKYTSVYCVQKQECPEIELLEFTGCIVDLRTYYQNFVCHLDPDTDLSPIQIATIDNCFVGYFANFYQDEPVIFDEPNIDVGAVGVIRNSSFDLTWNEADISWDIEDEPVTINWNNIGGILYHTTVITVIGGDTQAHKQVYTLDNATTTSVDVILPYTGKYDVIIELVGYNCNTTKRTYYDYFEVEMKEAEFMTFHRIHDKELQVWDTNCLAWDKIFMDWNSTVFDNEQFLIDDGEISFRTFDLINYLTLGTKAGFGELNFLDYDDNSWDNLEFIAWDQTVYETKRLANAVVGGFKPNDIVQIDDITLDIPTTINISNHTALALHWASITSEYEFTPRTDRFGYRFIEIVSVEGGTPANFFIASNGETAIGSFINLSQWNLWNDSSFGSWNDILISWAAADDMYRSDAKDEEFTMDNVRFYKNEFDCPRYVPIFFSNDDSHIAGKTKATYTFFNEFGEQVDQIEGLYIVKRFFDEGLFSVTCEIEDSNGNKKSLYKERIINITEHHEFRRLSKENKGSLIPALI